MLGGRHPAGSVEGVADGCEGVAAVAAGGGEVGADAAVALEGREGAPAAADLGGVLVAEAGVAGVAGGPDRGGGRAQRVAGLPGPGLGCRAGRVSIVEVPV